MLEIQWERENRLLLSWSLHSTGEADNEQTSRCLTYQWCQVLGESKRKGNRYCQVKLIFFKKLIDWLDICRKGTTIGKYPACVLSCVQLFAAPWTVALQAPLSMEFSRQEYYKWVAISYSRRSSQPRDPTHMSRALASTFFITEPLGKLPDGLSPTYSWLGVFVFIKINFWYRFYLGSGK